jgi:hypothetical protein
MSPPAISARFQNPPTITTTLRVKIAPKDHFRHPQTSICFTGVLSWSLVGPEESLYEPPAITRPSGPRPSSAGSWYRVYLHRSCELVFLSGGLIQTQRSSLYVLHGIRLGHATFAHSPYFTCQTFIPCNLHPQTPLSFNQVQSAPCLSSRPNV